MDWFHVVVKLFNSAVDEVRHKESKKSSMPSGVRWAVLKNANGSLTDHQQKLLNELERYAEETAKAWRIKCLDGQTRHQRHREPSGDSVVS